MLLKVHLRLAAIEFFMACLLVTLTGCSTLNFYGQAVRGQVELLRARRPLAMVIDDPTTPPAIQIKLRVAAAARTFASDALALPANASYTTYADLHREYMVWNVFAAPPYSLELHHSCYLIVGCLTYRGYFSAADAKAYGATLRQQGLEVFVGGVAAYSTLGWFSDPVASTMLKGSSAELVKTVFHELAHQLIYVPDDATFNESFATSVANLGFVRWRAQDPMARAVIDDVRDDAPLIALLLDTRVQLETLYASALPPADKEARKQVLFAELNTSYLALKAKWGGTPTYDRWMTEDMNNAKLASVATYHDYVPAFTALFHRAGDDFSRFYASVRDLAKLPPAARKACLDAAMDPVVTGCGPTMAAQRGTPPLKF